MVAYMRAISSGHKEEMPVFFIVVKLFHLKLELGGYNSEVVTLQSGHYTNVLL